jgi:Na+-transporting NADH:ubiquinone oxidoreductase subunit NqrF
MFGMRRHLTLYRQKWSGGRKKSRTKSVPGAVHFGPRRRLQEDVIELDPGERHEPFERIAAAELDSIDRKRLIERLIAGGLGTCKLESGGRDILPTELAHLTRRQRLEGIRVSCQLKVKEDMRIRIPDEIFNIRKYAATVVSNENVDLLRFTIRIATPPPSAGDEVPPGVGSSYVFSLKPGDKVTLSGPFGEFFIKETRREMCFIGGGAGMAPMRSHIFDQLLRVQTGRRITFWYGARSTKEMIYDEEFRELAGRFPNFTYTVALSEPLPEDRWGGPVGFIHQVAQDLYLGNHEDPTEIEYYLCGPPMMLRAVEKMLDGLGVDPDMIAYDEFG